MLYFRTGGAERAADEAPKASVGDDGDVELHHAAAARKAGELMLAPWTIRFRNARGKEVADRQDLDAESALDIVELRVEGLVGVELHEELGLAFEDFMLVLEVVVLDEVPQEGSFSRGEIWFFKIYVHGLL